MAGFTIPGMPYAHARELRLDKNADRPPLSTGVAPPLQDQRYWPYWFALQGAVWDGPLDICFHFRRVNIQYFPDVTGRGGKKNRKRYVCAYANTVTGLLDCGYAEWHWERVMRRHSRIPMRLPYLQVIRFLAGHSPHYPPPTRLIAREGLINPQMSEASFLTFLRSHGLEPLAPKRSLEVQPVSFPEQRPDEELEDQGYEWLMNVEPIGVPLLPDNHAPLESAAPSLPPPVLLNTDQHGGAGPSQQAGARSSQRAGSGPSQRAGSSQYTAASVLAGSSQATSTSSQLPAPTGHRRGQPRPDPQAATVNLPSGVRFPWQHSPRPATPVGSPAGSFAGPTPAEFSTPGSGSPGAPFTPRSVLLDKWEQHQQKMQAQAGTSTSGAPLTPTPATRTRSSQPQGGSSGQQGQPGQQTRTQSLASAPPPATHWWAYPPNPLPATKIDDRNYDAEDWEIRSNKLKRWFAEPQGMPFAIYFIRELLENTNIMADAGDFCLLGIRELGVLPDGVDSARPKGWAPSKETRMNDMYAFVTGVPEDGYDEQALLLGKIEFIRDLIALPELAKLYPSRPWKDMVEACDIQLETMRAGLDGTQMDTSRIPPWEKEDLIERMNRTLPGSAWPLAPKQLPPPPAGKGQWGTVTQQLASGAESFDMTESSESGPSTGRGRGRGRGRARGQRSKSVDRKGKKRPV